MYKRLFLILACLCSLAGCGGGGGDGGGSATPAYTGATTQATVTKSNATALSADAYTGSQLAAAASGVAKETGDTTGQSALLQETAGILKDSVGSLFDAQKSAAKVVAATAQDITYGYSGSCRYTINYDEASGAFSGTISFLQYKADSTSATLSGTIAFSGVYNQTTDAFSSLTITMSNLTGTSGNKSYRLDGSMTCSSSAAAETVTMSVVLTDDVSGRTYWVKDYSLIQVGSSLTVTGTYYDPVHGYVVITTVTPLTVSTVDAMPTAGQLLFTGSNGTNARLTFTGTGYTVEVDTTGTGTYVVVP